MQFVARLFGLFLLLIVSFSSVAAEYAHVIKSLDIATNPVTVFHKNNYFHIFFKGNLQGWGSEKESASWWKIKDDLTEDPILVKEFPENVSLRRERIAYDESRGLVYIQTSDVLNSYDVQDGSEYLSYITSTFDYNMNYNEYYVIGDYIYMYLNKTYPGDPSNYATLKVFNLKTKKLVLNTDIDLSLEKMCIYDNEGEIGVAVLGYKKGSASSFADSVFVSMSKITNNESYSEISLLKTMFVGFSSSTLSYSEGTIFASAGPEYDLNALSAGTKEIESEISFDSKPGKILANIFKGGDNYFAFFNNQENSGTTGFLILDGKNYNTEKAFNVPNRITGAAYGNNSLCVSSASEDSTGYHSEINFYQNTTSVISNLIIPKVKIQPNPIVNEAVISIPELPTLISNIEIYNAEGQKVEDLSTDQCQFSNEVTIRCSDWNPGKYFVRIKAENVVCSVPIVVVR